VAEAQAAEAMERRRAYKTAKYNKAYNKRRDPKYLAFYRSKDWKVTSRAKLQDCGYKCEAKLEGCGRIAAEVHHIKPLKTDDGWDARLDWDNLMGVCIACHNKLDGKNFGRRAEPGVIDLKELKR
jgi:5-methylcytosine-specific restriction endonuclease McrA